MRVHFGSSYLYQQEVLYRWRAYQRRSTPAAPPQTFFRKLVWWLSGQEHEEALQRRSEADMLTYEADMYAQGRGGEDYLQAVLNNSLDDAHVLLRNYVPAADRTGGDIDAILLGPYGITVFEVKAWHGYYLYHGDEWNYRAHPYEEWERATGNPTQQALMNAKRVRRLLARCGIQGVNVKPLIAIAEEDMHIKLDPPLAVPVLFLDQKPPRLDFALGVLRGFVSYSYAVFSVEESKGMT